MKGQEGSVQVSSYDPIDAKALKAALGPSLFARNVLCYETVDSTNTSAKELAEGGAAEGVVIVADEQTAGRGRRGRAWASPSGSNLYVSVLLRPSIEPDRVFVLTMVLALVIARAVRAIAGVPAMIKWPNDLFVENRKLAGILTEFATTGKVIDYVILGMGLNVNWHPEEGGGVTRPATSLLAETGRRFARGELLVEILKGLEESYEKVLKGEIDDFYRQWNELSLILGQPVVVESEREVLRGRAVRIDDRGALILMEERTGTLRRVISGDVSLRFDGNP